MKRASSPNLIELVSNSLLIRLNDRKNKKKEQAVDLKRS